MVWLIKRRKPLWEAEIGRDKLLNLGEAPILDEEKRRKILSELCDDLSEELYIRLMISLK